MKKIGGLNTLNTWPLPGIDLFIEQIEKRGIKEVNITGTNTDPMLCSVLLEIKNYITERLGLFVFGVRTNGVAVVNNQERWALFDKASITICSFDGLIYKRMMGNGEPPDLKKIIELDKNKRIKINIVLGPENSNDDIFETIYRCSSLGIKTINIREPYGQPHVGNPLEGKVKQSGVLHGMPFYKIGETDVHYWDVHYVEVESVNLYANGVVSTTYPITKGYHESGLVKPQSCFNRSI